MQTTCQGEGHAARPNTAHSACAGGGPQRALVKAMVQRRAPAPNDSINTHGAAAAALPGIISVVAADWAAKEVLLAGCQLLAQR